MSTGTAADAAFDQLRTDAAGERKDATEDAAKIAAAKDAKPATAKRGRGGKRPGAGRPAGAKTGQSTANLDRRLTDLFTMVGAATFAVNPADGMAIMQNAEPIAKALHELAKENAQVRRVLLAMLNTSAWGGVVMAVTPLALAIAGNHGMLPTTGPLAGLAGAMTGAPDGAAGDPAEPAAAFVG